MDEEPVNMLNPAHLNRAARGMFERLRAALPDSIEITLFENGIQFVWNGATVQVIADAYWRQNNVVCWFVSVSHPTHIGAHWPCTACADRALIDVGQAMRFADPTMGIDE
jgi:hypothetical protein